MDCRKTIWRLNCLVHHVSYWTNFTANNRYVINCTYTDNLPKILHKAVQCWELISVKIFRCFHWLPKLNLLVFDMTYFFVNKQKNQKHKQNKFKLSQHWKNCLQLRIHWQPILRNNTVPQKHLNFPISFKKFIRFTLLLPYLDPIRKYVLEQTNLWLIKWLLIPGYWYGLSYSW